MPLNKKVWAYLKKLAPSSGRYLVGGWGRSNPTIVTRATQQRRAREGRPTPNKKHEVDAGY